jgi:thioredoxin reductase
VARFEGRDGLLEAIVFDRGEPLARDGVFVGTTLSQRSALPEALGCALLADGCVEVGEFGATSVRGVFAAGDMARRAALPMPLAAVAPAAASGTTAGAAVDQDLLSADFALPNPFG